MRTPFVIALILLLVAGAPAENIPEKQREQERRIDRRDKAANGIVVNEPKVYDDAMLQQMLTAAQARLAALQVLDQASIVNRIGGVSGAEQRVNSFAITAQTPSLPQIVTTDKGATGSVVETAKLGGTSENSTSSPAGGTTTTASKETRSTDRTVQNTSGLATRDVATTTPQFNTPTATAAAPSVAMPTTAGVSASDILNEQMQLTYEIANLRLLLEGSLSDRLLKSSKMRLVKPRVTIGIPVTLRPDSRHKNAVAIVEVEVQKGTDIGDGEKPAITALLPREKTYNVASITESNASIGGGMVTQVIGFGGSFLRSRRTYYVVQDQDTLALTFPPETSDRSGVLWQFRPVLGRELVRSGDKQTFVQLAFPTSFTEPSFGKLFIRTYWRKYDHRKGLVKEILPGSLMENVEWNIPNYQLGIEPSGFGASSLEDMGDGQVLVKLQGRFLSSTYVRIGNTILREGPGLTFEHFGMRFAARLSDLVSKRVALVARDGTEIPLIIHRTLGTAGGSDDRPTIKAHSVSVIDESNSLLTLQLNDARHDDILPPLVIVAGGKVFGYADAPVKRSSPGVLIAVIPTALLLAQPEVTITWLFADQRTAVPVSLPEFSRLSRSEQLMVLEQGSTSAKFLLYGSRLAKATVVAPEKVELKAIGRPDDGDTLRLLEMTADQIKAHKRMVLGRPGERPVLIDIPAVEFKQVAKKELKARDRISIGSDEAVFEGDGLDKIKQILFRDRPIPFELASDKKSVRLRNLKALGVTSSAVPQDLVFIFDAVKTPVSIEVVNARYETIQRE
jgi:hypothetical protein